MHPYRWIGKHVKIFVQYVVMQQFSIDDICINVQISICCMCWLHIYKIYKNVLSAYL
jgi:hypothetical protein